VGAADHAKALWYYSKASFLGHPLSSAYVGVMHHFGLGVPVNLARAERYYALAIEQGADKSVATIVQSLKYALGMKDYYFLMPVNMGVDYVVRTLWSA
jgi:TPR repeat protein